MFHSCFNEYAFGDININSPVLTIIIALLVHVYNRTLVIPIILAFASFGIYKKYYTLKGEKMEEITRKVNEMHAKKQTA